MKTTNLFSTTLMERDIRANLALTLVITLIMILMSTIVNYAMSVMTAPAFSRADPTVFLNKIYFTVIGLLPIFIYIVVVANALIAGQVDSGALAYVLSTPIRRRAVALTHIVYLLLMPLLMIGLVCLSRILSTKLFFGEVCAPRVVMLYAGMYLLVEAVTAICFLGSCLFDLSRRSLAFGGGFTVWFFLASLLGMFGAEDMVEMGMGVEQLGVFNQLTLIGLFDINRISTIGTENVDLAFVPKLCALAAVALVCYIAGTLRFDRKDLPI